MHTSVDICKHVYPHIYVCMYIYVHVCIYVKICVYIYIYTCKYVYMYVYAVCKSAEASMASGQVDARPPILRTPSCPQSGEGVPRLTPPTAPARPAICLWENTAPRTNVEKRLCCSTLPCMGPQGSLKEPPRTPRPPQGPHRAPPGPTKAPEGSPMRPREPPSAQNTKTNYPSKTLTEALHGLESSI